MKNREKKGAWPVFFMVVGMLFIMTSPRTTQPAVMLIGGLAVVLISFAVWRKGRRAEKGGKSHDRN